MPEDLTPDTDRLAEDVASKVVGALRASQGQLENLAGVVAQVSVEVKSLGKELESISKIVKGNGGNDSLLMQIRLTAERLNNLEKTIDTVKDEFGKKIEETSKLAMKMEEKKLDIWKIIAGAIATIAAALAAAFGLA